MGSNPTLSASYFHKPLFMLAIAQSRPRITYAVPSSVQIADELLGVRTGRGKAATPAVSTRLERRLKLMVIPLKLALLKSGIFS